MLMIGNFKCLGIYLCLAPVIWDIFKALQQTQNFNGEIGLHTNFDRLLLQEEQNIFLNLLSAFLIFCQEVLSPRLQNLGEMG